VLLCLDAPSNVYVADHQISLAQVFVRVLRIEGAQLGVSFFRFRGARA